MSPRASVALLSALALLAAPGCFKSSTSQASSESSSKSSASSSRSSASSSGSSSPSSRENPYRADVSDYTQNWVQSGGDVDGFREGLAPIAEKNGITDWERDDATYVAIGMGLKKAGVSGERYAQYKRELSGGVSDAPGWIQQGYDKQKAAN